MTSRSNTNHLFAIAALFCATACGSGMLDVGFPTGPGNGGGGGSAATAGSAAAYVGVLADSLKHGNVTITVSPTLSVTGTLNFAGGPTVSLTGLVDTVQEEIHASGGGYTIGGFVVAGQLSAVYVGPGASGYIVATSDSLTGETHQTYCGQYASTNSNGRIMMQVTTGGSAAGFVIQTTGTSLSSFFNGTVVNSTIFTSVTQAGVALNGSVSPDQSAITGTYAPPVANSSGVNSATGTFSATRGGC